MTAQGEVDVRGRGSSGPAGLIEDDAAGDGFSRAVVWGLFWLPLVSLAALLAAAVIFRPAYDKMLEEDFPVEWGQFACCVFVSVVAGMTVPQAVRNRQWALAGLLLTAVLGWFFLAGEEISWGQRVFGIATPDGFEGNHQAETNLHNFDTGFDPERLFENLQLLISLAMLGLALYGRLGRPRPGSFLRIVSPPLFTVPLFLSLPGYRVFRLFVPGEVNFAVRLQEWAEFCEYAGLTVAVVCVYLAVRPAPRRDWRRLLPPAGIILATTLVFAVLSRFSGITAGNAL
ncbi:hypothetical protein KIH74_00720 [Kineosporia sp. J2-2]|uniref:Uncharacterized protein n=1 Tax=Kineosporia corallincola TaxID=2835133 RepID=A0ABS5T9B3_9ACTN|nr:hypothetical protein [Kineosporia corallincola]MBT0767423.1 hypothetical protein [Kineosporia corallincola]